MASNSLMFLVLSSISLTIFTLGQAVVNPGDLTEICSPTLKPDFCTKTLKAASDIHSLGAIALKEAQARAKYAPEYLESVAARSEPKLAKKYEACVGDYKGVLMQLDYAAEKYKNGEMMEAGYSAETAFSGVEISLERFKKPPVDSSKFTTYCVEIQTLCQAVKNAVEFA